MKKILLFVVIILGLLLASTIQLVNANDHYTISWEETTKILPPDDSQNKWFGSISVYNDYALIGSYVDDTNGYESGAAYIYKIDGNSWIQEAKLLPSDGESYDYFGRSVSLYGDYALIGAYGKDNHVGAAYIFKRDGNTWDEEKKLLPSDLENANDFGVDVCLNGDYAVIGAYNYDFMGPEYEDSGAVYIFKRAGDSWIEETKIPDPKNDINSWFGLEVFIDGDYAMVGAPGYLQNGSVFVFKRSGTNWIEHQLLVPSNPSDRNNRDNFGGSICIDGNFAVIGASDGLDQGSAYIFKLENDVWTQQTKITASDGNSDDDFGGAISIYEDTLIIGSSVENNNTGSVYFYLLDEDNWGEETKIIASDGQMGNYFGSSVFVNDKYAFIKSSTNNTSNSVYYVLEKKLNLKENEEDKETDDTSNGEANQSEDNKGSPGFELILIIVAITSIILINRKKPLK